MWRTAGCCILGKGRRAGWSWLPPSTSEDKDTWRGPGMLMANSTPTIHHLYSTAYSQKRCCKIHVLLDGLVTLVKK